MQSRTLLCNHPAESCIEQRFVELACTVKASVKLDPLSLAHRRQFRPAHRRQFRLGECALITTQVRLFNDTGNTSQAYHSGFVCRMVNLGMFHLLDKAKSIDFSEAIACLLQQPWVVFSCQIQKAADRQLKVSTVQFATAGGEVYIFDCLTLGTQAIHEHGLAWLLQSPHLKKIMYSSDNTAAALWRQLKVQIAGTIDLQALTATPQHWPSLQYGSDPAYLDFNSDNICSASAPKSSLSASAPFPISTQVPKPADGSILNSTHQTTHHVNVDANSQKSGRRGHESPQAVLDLMLDDLESEALSSSHEIVYEFTKEAPARRSSSLQPMGGSWLCKQPQGRCSSMGSMSLLDSMQLMELPILPGKQQLFVVCAQLSQEYPVLHAVHMSCIARYNWGRGVACCANTLQHMLCICCSTCCMSILRCSSDVHMKTHMYSSSLFLLLFGKSQPAYRLMCMQFGSVTQQHGRCDMLQSCIFCP